MHQSRFVRNIRLGVKNLLLHKLRSLLTVLGVVFGVGSVIAMLAVGEGASQQALDQIRKLGSNNIILTAVKPAEDEQANTTRTFMSMYGLLYDDEARISETLPSVVRTVPVKYVRKDGYLGDRQFSLRVLGTTPAWFDLVNRPVVAGRVLTQRDFDEKANVCVLTEYGARRLLATQHSVGQLLRIGSDAYKVVGIVQSESSGGSIETPDQQVDAYIPLDAARERYGDIFSRRSAGSMERSYIELNQILVQVRSSEQVKSTAAAIEHLLQQFHPKKDYKVSVPLALLEQAERTKRTFNIVLGSIAGISLLVGGIGIMNIMLASVTERTREIGVRRAIGARKGQIVSQFLIETMVLSSIGGFMGVAIGVLIPWIITVAADMPTVVPVYGIVLSLGISVAEGVVFGLYPAVRAANLDPIEALRHE